MFEERNLLFLPFPFPFQSSVHSWSHCALHADERELTFSRTHVQTKDGQEMGQCWCRKAEGRQRYKDERFCDEAEATVTDRMINKNATDRQEITVHQSNGRL